MTGKKLVEPAREDLPQVESCPARATVGPNRTEGCRFLSGHEGPHEDRFGLRWGPSAWMNPGVEA